MSIEAMKQALETLDGLSEPYDVLKAKDALRQAIADAEKQEPVAGYYFLLTNDTMRGSIEKLIAHAKRARWTNAVFRKDGVETTYEADWIKTLVPYTHPQSQQEHGSPEDMYVEMHKHLNCPHCGGSGHIDDVKQEQGERQETNQVTLTQTNVGIGKRGMEAYEAAKKRGWVGVSDERLMEMPKQAPVECMCGICKLGKREWVSLTNEEVMSAAYQAGFDIHEDYDTPDANPNELHWWSPDYEQGDDALFKLRDLIEAKLKEKNT
jgi:hypothetical protein